MTTVDPHPVLTERLHVGLQLLSERERQVIDRTVVSGWTLAEVARDLDICIASVRHAEKEALRKLKEYLE